MRYSYPFRQKAHRERHDTAPLLEERDEYLNYLLHGGTSPRRVHAISRTLLTVIHFLQLRPTSTATVPAIETAGVRWKESIHASCGRVVPQEAFDDFRRVAIDWLRYRGLLIETPKSLLK